jgi:hypothetical protein
MSSTWRMVASPKALSFSSGTYCATLAFSSSLPSATRICPIRPKKDLVTDCAMCWPSTRSAPP